MKKIILIIGIVIMIFINGCEKEFECKQISIDESNYFLYVAKNGSEYKIDDICDFDNPDIKCVIINETFSMLLDNTKECKLK